MKPIRVLLVDDSLVVRSLLSRLLGAVEGIEVVGAVRDGVAALEELPRLTPDVVTLDVEMPRMDGLQTLTELRRRSQSVAVIMCSSHTRDGAEATLKALSLGAQDFVCKPQGEKSFEDSKAHYLRELVPRIELWGRRAEPSSRASSLEAAPERPARRDTEEPAELVAIGCSTGGPEALRDLLPRIPTELGVPIVIVQHMPPLFIERLAQMIDQDCDWTVREAYDGAPLRAGEVWIARGAVHTTVRRAPVGLTLAEVDSPPVNSCRPSADVLFASVAKACGDRAVGVVLTGMGRDGCDGACALVEVGARVCVQDEESSVVWGMPGAVVSAGLAHRVVSLIQMPATIRALVANSPRRRS